MCECLHTLVVDYATLEYTQHWETRLAVDTMYATHPKNYVNYI